MNLRMFRIPVSVYILLLVSLLLSCSEAGKKTTLKLAHGLDTSHPVHKGMEVLAKRLEELSGGQLTVRMYPGAQLGSERENLELLQIGSLDMTKVSAAVMENFAPNFKVLGLPYIFHSREHQYAVLDGPIGTELLGQGEKYWMHGLTFYDAGSRSFYSKTKPILSPDDLNGLKIRVMPSKTAVDMVKAFGGSPTPISYGELYTALQQGVVDGAENNPPSFFFSRHYEVCKFYSINEHTAVPDVLLVSMHTWEKLSPQEKQWLQQAARESAVEQRKLWQESERETLEAVQKAGVEVIYPDKAPFMAKVENIFETYRSEPEVYQLIQQIRQQGVQP